MGADSAIVTPYEGLFVGGAALPALPVTAGLALYLRADLGVTLGTGSRVAAWADQSGAGNNFAQPTQLNQPSLTAGAGPKASLPGVTFTAANSTFLTCPTAPTTSTDQTIFLVLKTTTVAGTQFIFQNGLAGTGVAPAIGQTATKRSVFVVGGADASDGAATTAWEEWGYTTTNTTPLQTFRVNGVGQALSSSALTQVIPGAGAGLGSPQNGAGPYFDGNLWLLLEYSRVLSGAEIAQVESWISSITGIF